MKKKFSLFFVCIMAVTFDTNGAIAFSGGFPESMEISLNKK